MSISILSGLIDGNFEKILSVFALVSISLGIRLLLQALGQTWVKTVAHTATLVLLPLITYIITNVISGNIALSLGMVGALSIVRFRNPVRSPLELSVYFGAITMGISAAVSMQWLFFLVASVLFAAFSLVCANFLFIAVRGQPFFEASFSEGNSLGSLEISCSERMLEIEASQALKSKNFSDGRYQYLLAGSDFDELRNLQIKLESLATVTSLQLNR
jgi:hypothetical protein